MRQAIATLSSLLALCVAATAAERLKFWNLTGSTIKELHLAPVGTANWGLTSAEMTPMEPSTSMSV
jgi:hypothetical protein